MIDKPYRRCQGTSYLTRIPLPPIFLRQEHPRGADQKFLTTHSDPQPVPLGWSSAVWGSKKIFNEDPRYSNSSRSGFHNQGPRDSASVVSITDSPLSKNKGSRRCPQGSLSNSPASSGSPKQLQSQVYHLLSPVTPSKFPTYACLPSSYSQPLHVQNPTSLALLLHVISTASSPTLAFPSHTVLQPRRLIWPRDYQSRSKSKPVPCSVGARTQLGSNFLHLRREANLRHGKTQPWEGTVNFPDHCPWGLFEQGISLFTWDGKYYTDTPFAYIDTPTGAFRSDPEVAALGEVPAYASYTYGHSGGNTNPIARGVDVP